MFIGSGSWLFLTAVTDGRPAPADADVAVGVLRADYERWTRCVWGLAAFVITVVGVFTAGGVVLGIAELGRLTLVDVVAVLVAAVMALAGAGTLVLLWRSGRTLTRAIAWWSRAPYEAGARSPDAAGWVRARTVNLEPPILVRLITATLALLMAVGGIAVVVRDVVHGASPFTVPMLLVAVVAGLSGLGQVGGVFRIVNGLSSADPVWSRSSRMTSE